MFHSPRLNTRWAPWLLVTKTWPGLDRVNNSRLECWDVRRVIEGEYIRKLNSIWIRQGNYISVMKFVRKFTRLLCYVGSFNFKQKKGWNKANVLPNLLRNTAETCNRVIATRVEETEETCWSTQRLKHSSRLRKLFPWRITLEILQLYWGSKTGVQPGFNSMNQLDVLLLS